MWHHLAGRIERCDECRFDGSAYTDDDVSGTIRKLARWAQGAMDGIDPVVLNQRPEPTTWSPAEYLRHIKRVVWSMAGLAELLRAEPGQRVDGVAPSDATVDDPPTTIDVGRELVRLDEEAVRLGWLWSDADVDDRACTIDINGETADLAGIVRHTVHDATHHLGDIGRGIAALGVGTPEMTGRVQHIHSSAGGVPKLAIDEATVGYRGLEGDRQAIRKHHGRVWQALCLWSSEVIDALVAEGHPLTPGAAGENFTISGIDWSALRPGAHIRFGGDGGVLAETTGWTTPCTSIVEAFTDRDYQRIDVARDPGVSRIYAKVLIDGLVRTGDPVKVF